MNYIYDGTFEGLLTAIYEAYYRRENPDRILMDKNLQYSFLEENVFISTDEIKSEKVYNSIRTKISNQALRHTYYTYLSSFDESGTWIYNYLKLGWKAGKKIDFMLSDDRVLLIHNIVQKVVSERHLMLGLIRFKKLSEGLYYAPIEPDHNIVSLVAPHFKARLSDQNWIIHDVKRRLAALYNKKEWIVSDFDANPNINQNADETLYNALWKEYYDSISIMSRSNLKLQKRYMPRRYWKYLVEKQ